MTAQSPLAFEEAQLVGVVRSAETTNHLVEITTAIALPAPMGPAPHVATA